MGRGLSYLQKGILCLAYKNLKHGWGKPCVTTAEVLMGVKHSAARVSVSRAFRRLEKRGLVVRWHEHQLSGKLVRSGIELTIEGLKVAGVLMVNTVDD